MASTYPHYPYFYAAYGITALILLGYAISLYRRYTRTKALRSSARAMSEPAPR